MSPVEQGIILGIVLICGYTWVKSAPTFTSGLFRTGTALVVLALCVAAWF